MAVVCKTYLWIGGKADIATAWSLCGISLPPSPCCPIASDGEPNMPLTSGAKRGGDEESGGGGGSARGPQRHGEGARAELHWENPP